MKGGLRQSMAWLHTWGGLLISWLLFVVLWTGTLAVFAPEITHWMQPERQQTSPAASQVHNATAAIRYLEREASSAAMWRIELPSPRSPAITVAWPESPGGEWAERIVDAATFAGIAPRATEGGEHFGHFHAELHAGTLGIWLVALSGLMMLVAVVSGVIIHKRIFSDFFTFRPRASAQRSWLDGHNAGGVVLLPFHLMIAYTGLACHFAYYMPAALNLHFDGDPDALRSQIVDAYVLPPAGAPGELAPVAPMFQRAEEILGRDTVNLIIVRNPADANASIQFYRGVGDRLALVADHVNFRATTGEFLGSQTEWNAIGRAFRSLVGLHFAQFGGWTLQWLYFLAGLASCGMVAAGLVLFAVKRRKKYDTAGPVAAALYQSAERLNIIAVAGLVAASAAYLWANRLLPVDMGERAYREMGAFFVVWALTAIHGFARPVIAGWREQLGLAALLCLGLPVLDVLTAGPALMAALHRGDMVPLAVDLGGAALGLLLAAVAFRLHRRWQGTVVSAHGMLKSSGAPPAHGAGPGMPRP